MGLEKPSVSGGSVDLKFITSNTQYLNRGYSFSTGDSSVLSGVWLFVVHEVTNNSLLGLYSIRDGVITVDNNCPYCEVSVDESGVVLLQNLTTTQTGFTVYLYKM